LLQRGENFFCDKVINCMAGGGRAAIIFNRDDQPACEPLGEVTLLSTCDPEPEAFIPVLGLTRSQGQALKALVLKGGVVNATLSIPEVRRRQAAPMAQPHCLALTTGSGLSRATRPWS
jgi:hypothetical protein